MTVLAVRTRGDAPAQGKARVYFSCHPEDFEVSFPLIAEDVFRTQNCAIFYERSYDQPLREKPDRPYAGALFDSRVFEQASGPADGSASGPAHASASGASEAPDADPDDLLAQMQLFIFPVTSRFLRGHCRAYEYEYGFAMEHHIPVLPVLMEPGLAEYFAARLERLGEGYGQVQFLDRTSADPTEIPYAEKLQKRLAQVLASDETAQRVRAAFDAYIFLSYRKKDRRCARQLMELIHQIPGCRDIAIWYDEFLVPGEDWSAAIAEAMNKSALVTLAVTPQITEPGNYIIDHEYPDAVASGKPIVPAEMQRTDRERLQSLFPGLPELINGRSLSEVAQALQAIATTSNDSDPAHNFLIGLAYLGAIDVERDPQRALELITSAASDGLPEAMEKLVSMYETGEAVRADYRKALHWQERLTDAVRAEYRRSQDPAHAKELISQLWGLEERQAGAGHPDEAERSSREMLTLARTWQERGGDARHFSRYESAACTHLGALALGRGRPEEARGWYERAYEIDRKLLAERGTYQARRDLAIECVGLGRIESSSGKLSEAQTWYRQALELHDENLRILTQSGGTPNGSDLAPDDPDRAAHEAQTRADRADIYSRMGDTERFFGHMAEARSWYEQSLEVRGQLAGQLRTDASEEDLASIYSDLGDLEMADGNYAGALAWYRKALPIYTELTERLGHVDLRRSLAATCADIAGGEKWMWRPGETEIWYRKALQIRQQLAEETGLPSDRRQLARTLSELGDFYRERREDDAWTQAEDCHRQAYDIRKELAQQNGSRDDQKDYAAALSRMGDAAARAKRADEARAYYLEMLQISTQLAEGSESAADQRRVTLAYNKLGNLARDRNQPEEAKHWYEQMLPLYERIAATSDALTDWRNIAVGYQKMGDIERAAGHNEAARTWYEKELAHNEQTVRRSRSLRTRFDVATAHYCLWSVMPNEEGRRHLKQAEEIMLGLKAEYGSNARVTRFLAEVQKRLKQ